jgi:hypothetical protein
MNRNRLIMLFQIHQVLSPAQRAKLQELGWSGPNAGGASNGRDRR